MLASSLILLWFVLLAVSQGSDGERAAEAQRHYEEGVRLCELGRVHEGMSELRLATELKPSSVRYMNGLGVSLLRTKRYDEAASCFSTALALPGGAGDSATEENLEATRQVLSQLDEERARRQLRPRHRLSCPLEVSLAELYGDDSAKDTTRMQRLLSRPFLVRGAAASSRRVAGGEQSRQWGGLSAGAQALRARFSTGGLRRRYGGARTDYYPYSLTHSKIKPFFKPLAEGLDYLLSPDLLTAKSAEFLLAGEGDGRQMRQNDTGQYLQWNLQLREWRQLLDDAGFQPPPALDDMRWLGRCLRFNVSMVDDFLLKTHWKMLLIGAASSGMFNHQDTLRASAWQLQVVGSKQWHICSPEQGQLLYEAGDVDTFHPDYARHPLLAQASCFSFTVFAGDLVYYPGDYWHQTLNTGFSIALSSSVVHRSSHRHVHHQLRQECRGRRAIFSPADAAAPTSICRDGRLARCFSDRHWGHAGDG
mmetsp:Transcript_30667/g.57160  ORF Transcript_30667/g.57160 Transcript_30667/m.57160 type:complete len:478 (+) Transcript_30667:50-1483(+)